MRASTFRSLATVAAAGTLCLWARGAFAAAETSVHVVPAGDIEVIDQGVTVLDPILFAVMLLGVAVLSLGMLLCVWRMMRGPHLADRVLAGDTLAFHVVGLVIVLGMWLRTTVFFDAALVVAIIGFASTVAFAQYIGAAPDADTPLQGREA